MKQTANYIMQIAENSIVEVIRLLGSNLDIGQISSPWGLLTFFILKNSIQAKPSVSSEPSVPPRSSTGLKICSSTAY